MKTLTDALYKALHIYQEAGGDLDAVKNEIRANVLPVAGGKAAEYLNDWLTSYPERSDEEKYRDLVHFWMGLCAAS